MSSNWRKTREYRVWRVKVIRRDKRCVVCGSIKDRQAHHLNSGSYFPDERYDVDNGVCLCKECHINFHNNFKNNYKEKCTKKDFCNFMDLYSYFYKKISNKIFELFS